MTQPAEILHEEVLITSDQDVINEKLADGTYRVKMAVPMTSMEMGQPANDTRVDIAYGQTMICYILVKLVKA